MQVALGIVFTILCIIGLRTVCVEIYSMLICGNPDWKADITISAKLRNDTPIEQLINTIKFVRMKYFPKTQIVIICDELSDENIKTARLSANEGEVIKHNMS